MNNVTSKLSVTVASAVLLMAITSCATEGGTPRPRPQLESCPPGDILICEGQGEPSRGGDGEIKQYERCRCESAI